MKKKRKSRSKAKPDKATGVSLLEKCSPLPLLEKIKKDEPATQPNDIPLNNEEAEDWANQFRADLERFLKWAQRGDSAASSLLHYAASLGTEALGKLSHSNPESLHFISKKMLRWPVMIGRYEKVGTKNKELLERLGMDEPGLLPYTPSDATGSSYYAGHLIGWLLGERDRGIDLPNLTKDTWEIWFEVGWLAILKATNGNPQDDKILGEIVRNVKKPEKEEEEVIGEANFKAHEEKVRAGVTKKTRNRKTDEGKLKRNALRKKLKQEFRTPVLHLIEGGWS